jgi:hypothetical protein
MHLSLVMLARKYVGVLYGCFQDGHESREGKGRVIHKFKLAVRAAGAGGGNGTDWWGKCNVYDADLASS